MGEWIIKKTEDSHDGAREDNTQHLMAETPKFELSASRQFTSWLREQRISLAFTTYQTGKLFLLGLREEGKLSVFERTFERAMGLAISRDAQTLWLSTLYQFWR